VIGRRGNTDEAAPELSLNQCRADAFDLHEFQSPPAASVAEGSVPKLSKARFKVVVRNSFPSPDL
jgi:hypothetical protein